MGITYVCIAFVFITLGLLIAICVNASNAVNAKKYIEQNKEHLFSSCYPYAQECKNAYEYLYKYWDTFDNYISEIQLSGTIQCSRAAISNAEMYPVKSIMKYTRIDYSDDCLNKISFCIEYISKIDYFHNKINQLKPKIQSTLPASVWKHVRNEPLPYIICDIDEEINSMIEKPVLCFEYISPAGRNKDKIVIPVANYLTDIQSELQNYFSKEQFIKIQRARVTNELREKIKRRDNYTCCRCGNSIWREPNLLLEVDHIIPVSKGGETEPDNLQTLCWRCNRQKSDKVW